MEIGQNVSFVHIVNGERDYLTGVLMEHLPNGKFLVKVSDNTEFELTAEEILN